tara:strand:- start:360 stop:977 length:618 start_codon:yes stop_codon:yes gene_type:complete
MFDIFLYLAIFSALVYGVFQGLLSLSNSLFLIDEYFINSFKNNDDKILNNLISKNIDPNQNYVNNKQNEADNINDEKYRKKKINSYLRFDFFITLFLGIIWFIFPKLLINLNKEEIIKINPENKYLSKWIATFTLITCYLPLTYIKNDNIKKKKEALICKLILAVGIIIMYLVYIYYIKRINLSNIINTIFLSVWISNSILGLSI